MWRILGALALSSGCLFAPARPGDDMGGDDCTLPSEDADLPIVGVFPSGEGDMLVRAGIDRGVQRVNFYDPSPAFSPVCATRSVELTALGGIAVDKVLAIGRMTDRYLLVLVQRADTLAAVYQIDVTTDPPLLTQSAITSAAEIAPVRATPGPFVAYSERAGEVWFGGPLIHRATPGPTFGADSKLVTVTGHNQEGWYLAVGADALTNDRFVIVGQRADYPAISGSTGTTIDTQQTAPRDSTCDLDLPQCQDRTARAVTNAPPGAVPIAALSFTPEGQVTAVQTEGTALLLLQRDLVAGAAVLEDVALSLLAPTGVLPTTDAFTLTRTSINGRLAVEWHPNAFSTPIATPPASSFVLKTGAALERLVVGTFVPRKGPKILVLGNQPGLADAGETYLEVVDGELVEYPLPAR